MQYREIRKALEEGKIVHWMNQGYTLMDCSNDNKVFHIYIVWNYKKAGENSVGMNEHIFNAFYKSSDFFLGE